MFSLHATKKLLDRVKAPVEPVVSEPTTALGNWYGTVLFWRPQVALLVNEQTLYPILMPLAPAAMLMDRFPGALRQILGAHGVSEEFIEAVTAEMTDGRYAKTESRSLLGIMNEFRYLAEAHPASRGVDLVSLALRLSETPCGPLYKRHGSPDRELQAAVDAWFERQDERRSG
ncbi:MAG TPA: hypothetical protein VI980_05110 [Acidimicrobiia bacterium]|nr:hypothetical protein [Acidimicrobiia bacterium]